MAKHTLKILLCEHRKIFKVCLAIFLTLCNKGLNNPARNLIKLYAIENNTVLMFTSKAVSLSESSRSQIKST